MKHILVITGFRRPDDLAVDGLELSTTRQPFLVPVAKVPELDTDTFDCLRRGFASET